MKTSGVLLAGLASYCGFSSLPLSWLFVVGGLGTIVFCIVNAAVVINVTTRVGLFSTALSIFALQAASGFLFYSVGFGAARILG
ncbi:MAG: hypothetical protein ACRBBN_09750 [Methyloligellaceae bacterium]